MTCPDCAGSYVGDQCVCGWVRPGAKQTVIYRSTEAPKVDGAIEKEQFGVNLYNAISLVGAVMQVKEYRAQAVMGTLRKQMDHKDLKVQDKKLTEQLHTAMQALTADELLELTRRYPWTLN